MTQDFENRLRDALRPVDPDTDLARRVMLRVSSDTPATSGSPRRSSIHSPRLRWFSAALAASVLLALLGVYEWQVRRERSGLEARRQLMQALQLTGEKLDLAYQVINRQSTGHSPGA